jgi:type II secretory pathway pseudopilin PulG
MALQRGNNDLAATGLITMRNRKRNRPKPTHGFMLIELMISMVVLTVGLGGLLVLLISAMYTDRASASDTTATMVAEHVVEQITAEGVNNDNALSITDCANNVMSIATLRAPLGAGNGGANGGNGAALTVNGIIDWNNQTFAAVPTDGAGNKYAIDYVACGANGKQTSYEVRWNVIQLSGTSRLTIIGARPSGNGQLGGVKFVIPVNLRTID